MSGKFFEKRFGKNCLSPCLPAGRRPRSSSQGRVVFDFFDKLFTNAERMNNISKSL